MEKYKRLEIVIHLLEAHPFISKKKILEYFMENHELELSARTLERDFQVLETDFHIAVHYNRAKRGYALMEEDALQITTFLSFAGRMYLADLFRKGLKDFEKLQSAIKLEDYSGFEGLKNIEPLFLAIQQKRSISFKHENYIRNSIKEYKIVPFQLKEYQGRWYVVGLPIEENGIKVEENIVKNFGLARCKQVKLCDGYKIDSSMITQQIEKYEQIIGLNYDAAEKREIIELAVTKQQFKYLKSLPLHKSQLVKGEMTDGRIKISLHLIPNYALEMQLLKLGEGIEVLSPSFLRERIIERLNTNLKQYKNEK